MTKNPDHDSASDQTDNSAKTRKPWQFQPGKSGNPGGRSRIIAEVRALAQKQAPDAIARLVELMHCDQPTVAVRACEAILDRAIGRPMQAVELGSTGELAELLRDLAQRRTPDSHPVERARANQGVASSVIH